jgi:hypothetical protein
VGTNDYKPKTTLEVANFQSIKLHKLNWDVIVGSRRGLRPLVNPASQKFCTYKVVV